MQWECRPEASGDWGLKGGVPDWNQRKEPAKMDTNRLWTSGRGALLMRFDCADTDVASHFLSGLRNLVKKQKAETPSPSNGGK